jgi:hypothetical protein
MLHVKETSIGQLLNHRLALTLPLAQQAALASGTHASVLICLAQTNRATPDQQGHCHVLTRRHVW